MGNGGRISEWTESVLEANLDGSGDLGQLSEIAYLDEDELVSV